MTNYQDIKQMLDIFTDGFYDIDAISTIIATKKVAHTYEDNVYFTSMSDKYVEIRARTGKVYNIPPNLVISQTTLLSKVSANYVNEYYGRAKTLWECPKIVYIKVLEYYNTCLLPINEFDYDMSNIIIDDVVAIESDYEKGKGIDRSKYLDEEGVYIMDKKERE